MRKSESCAPALKSRSGQPPFRRQGNRKAGPPSDEAKAKAWVSVEGWGRRAGGFYLPLFLFFREVRRAEQSSQTCHSRSSCRGKSVNLRRGRAARREENLR